MGTKTTKATKTNGNNYTHDVSCNYENIAGIAGEFKRLLAGENPSSALKSAATDLKAAGDWGAKDLVVQAFRSIGDSVERDIEDLGKLADRMERVAEIMRTADDTVNLNANS